MRSQTPFSTLYNYDADTLQFLRDGMTRVGIKVSPLSLPTSLLAELIVNCWYSRLQQIWRDAPHPPYQARSEISDIGTLAPEISQTDLFFLGFILGFLGFLVRKILGFFLGFFSRAEKF